MSDWNRDWDATGAGVDWANVSSSPAFIQPFLDAVDERWNAISTTAGTTTLPSAGDDAIFILAGAWVSLQNRVMDYARYFVRQGTSEAWTPEAQPWIDGVLFVYDLTYDSGFAAPQKFYRPVPFPSPNWWHRTFSREIYTLSQAGSDGQRARFCARFNNAVPNWFSVPSTDALFAQAVLTPMGEQQYTGKFFDHVSGAWTLSSDQVSGPNILTEDNFQGADLGASLGFQYTCPGDHFTGKWLNRLRDAINQLTRTAGGFAVNSPGAPGGPMINGIPLLSFQADYTAPAVTANGSSNVSAADCEANYDASVTTYSPTTPPTGLGLNVLNAYGAQTDNGLGTTFYTLGRIAATISNLDPAPNNQSLSRVMSAWVIAQAGGAPFIAGAPSFVFNQEGNTVLEEEFTSAGSTATTANTDAYTLPGPEYGTGSRPAVPAGAETDEGWTVFAPVILLDWHTAGGFAHTSTTP